MKNIFVEGIQGSGKSTLINNIVKFNPELHVCREGDYSPIELAWCALMSKKEYEAVLEKYNSIRDEIIKNTVREQENYIITYTKIITDIPGFYNNLENYEVYNGRKTLAELKEIIVTRFKNFTDTGYLFECSFFQNVIEDLILFHMLSDEEIIEFYCNLFGCIDAKKFILFYLYSDKLEENIKTIQKERCDEDGNELWYQMMLEYLVKSPYGRKHGCSTFEDLISHFKHRQELELRIVKEIIGKNAVIIPAKEYDVNQIRTLIGSHSKISYNIRHMNNKEIALLDDFLYEAIFIPEGVDAPPKEVNCPKLSKKMKCDVSKLEFEIIAYDFQIENHSFKNGIGKIAFNFAVDKGIPLEKLSKGIEIDQTNGEVKNIEFRFPVIPFVALNPIDKYLELDTEMELYHNLILFS